MRVSAMARRCKQCKDAELMPASKCADIIQKKGFCSAECLVAMTRAKAAIASEKQRKKQHREDLKRVRRNPRAEALIAAQLLGRISNADDEGNCKCVTCEHVGPYNNYFDGGHFIAKGSSSYWMLDPRNIHPQCKSCNGNGMKFGNKEAQYTLWMVDKYGREFVEHMQAVRGTVTKRSTCDYDKFLIDAKAEIARHKKRIGNA